MTQPEVILAHLRKHGRITSFDAFSLYHITRLSAVIYVLRDEGHRIKTDYKTSGKSTYAEYKLEKKDEKEGNK